MVEHLDLFSGIGGFALAAQRAGWSTIGMCLESSAWLSTVQVAERLLRWMLKLDETRMTPNDPSSATASAAVVERKGDDE